MKVTPLAQGLGVAGADVAPSSPSRLERAKAIAAGQTPEAAVVEAPSSGDPQVDKIRKIRMKTQVSTNRDDVVLEEPVVTPPTEPEITTPDTVEQAQGTEETKPLSPQFAALAKAKRALQVKERELAQREEALKSQPAGEGWKDQLKANPLGVLQDVIGPGVYDQLTEAIINNQNAPIDPVKLRNEIKEELKKELFGELTTRDQQAEQQVLAEIRRDAMNLTAQGDDFEAIRQAKAQNTVVDLIHRTWKQTGEILDTSEAAKLVEEQLIEEAVPFAKLNKVQSRLTPAQEKFVEKILTQAPKANTKVMRTLTNRDSASPIMDRRARAIAAMNGTLKKG